MKKIQIAHFGTFDIYSFGDTLFADALAMELPKRIDCEITIFSKKACSKPYSPQVRVHSFEEFASLHKEKRFDVVLVGGGELFHYRDIQYFANGKEEWYKAGMFWKSIIDMGYKEGLPVYFCGIGVPYDFTPDQCEELVQYSEKVACIAARDEFSFQRLQAAGIPENKLMRTADMLWCMQQIFPDDVLEEHRRELCGRTGIDFTQPYIAVQYGTTKDCKEIAEQLEKLQKKLQLPVVLFTVNTCHEDRAGNRAIKQWADTLTLVDEDLKREEIAAIIARAELFLGTSFHGNVTAALYGVPFVGIDMYPGFVSKMDGLFTGLQCEQYLSPEAGSLFLSAMSCIADRENAARVAESVQQMKEKKDQLFDYLAESLRRKQTGEN